MTSVVRCPFPANGKICKFSSLKNHKYLIYFLEFVKESKRHTEIILF